MNTRILLATALSACAFVAQAQSTSVDTATPQADAQVASQARARDDSHCLRYTGSFIVSQQNRQADMHHGDAPADASKPKHRCIYSAGQVYTREDIENTGQNDIGRALQMLDPSVTIGH